MVELFKEGVNLTKDFVSGSVFTSEVPPGLNNSFVITVVIVDSQLNPNQLAAYR